VLVLITSGGEHVLGGTRGGKLKTRRIGVRMKHQSGGMADVDDKGRERHKAGGGGGVMLNV